MKNLFMSHFQSNVIQSEVGIAELNPDEYFNNILRTLRDAIDGKFQLFYLKNLKVLTTI